MPWWDGGQFPSAIGDGRVNAKPRLGRGLDALFGADGNQATAVAQESVVAIERIQQNPYQPRKAFDTEEMSGLCESIKAHGLLQPLVVRAQGDAYQLIAGERRLRAAQSLGFTEVPVHVVNFNDQESFEAALVENIQRSDLNPIEKAQGFKEYLDRFSMTQEDLAAKLGLDRTTISNLVGLLDLAPEVQDAVRSKQITLGHAKVLKGIKNRDRQVALCKETIARGYSVHALETLIKQQKTEKEPEPEGGKTSAPKTAHVQAIENELRQSLSTKVEIRLKSKDKGQIVLLFDSEDDFQRLLEVLRK
ncbi:MAG: ParB/RepB/Spo0J family partition protein [Gemmataceae bacterium]|nr:ParB/RepB/Spo0J family partition protein [Gemmataceae bacterium]